jgi:hypothetical protein
LHVQRHDCSLSRVDVDFAKSDNRVDTSGNFKAREGESETRHHDEQCGKKPSLLWTHGIELERVKGIEPSS